MSNEVFIWARSALLNKLFCWLSLAWWNPLNAGRILYIYLSINYKTNTINIHQHLIIVNENRHIHTINKLKKEIFLSDKKFIFRHLRDKITLSVRRWPKIKQEKRFKSNSSLKLIGLLRENNSWTFINIPKIISRF